MARIVLTTWGSLGDLHPYLAISRELQKRGHTPVLATSETYRERIEALNFDFAPVRPDLPSPELAGDIVARAMHPTRGTPYLFRELLMPHLRDSSADLSRACIDADLLLSHPITFAAPLVAQKQNLRWLSSVLSPVSLWSVFDAPVGPFLGGRWLPKIGVTANRMIKELAHAGTRVWFTPVDELRRELGLSRGAHPLFAGQHSPRGVLALFSRVLATPQSDWPVNTTLCGPCFFEHNVSQVLAEELAHDATAASTCTDDWRAWLEEGTPPILFTLGSAAVQTARDFWDESLAALRILNSDALRPKVRALWLVGENSRWHPTYPPTRAEGLAISYAPFGEIMARSRAVVHQGGIGTTQHALQAGVPQLVVPFSHDQPDNAYRIEQLGAGLSVPRAQYRAVAVARRLKHLLDEPRYKRRAQVLATHIARENGPQRAAEVIETALLSPK